MARYAPKIELTNQEFDRLRSIANSHTAELRQVKRARIILACSEGKQNKQVALDTANQNLEDAYEDALNTLDDAYLKAYNSQSAVDTIQRTYFTSFDQEGIRVKENSSIIC